MISESEYTRHVGIAHRKKFAQFFTPEPIAAFMADWVMQDKKACKSVLEPAFGLGVFSRVLLKKCPDASVTGYDIDTTIFRYASENFSANESHVCLKNEDYLESPWNECYDGILCNPPYQKFHDYDNGRYVPIVNEKLRTRLNGFTNIYSLFLLKSISQLNSGGRLAYIVPSEFLNADYGVEVKRALLASGTLRHIVVVDFTKCAFDDAITTACILFCQKGNHSDDIKLSKIDAVEELSSTLTNYTSIPVTKLDPEVKWKMYYEQSETSSYQHLVPFSTFAKVSRGIATGANNYFIFNTAKKEYYNLSDNSFLPCIAHSVDVKSLIFTESDFNTLSEAEKNIYLFNGQAADNDLHVKQYIRLGEEAGINSRYLTASRSPWYALERRPASPIWVTVFNRNGLRFVRNEANVYNLTTFHCVYNTSEVETDVLFAYLVTDFAKEIILNNSRQYGNGLVKFEPNDLNRANVADLRRLNKEEKDLILQIYECMHFYGSVCDRCIRLLDEFFRAKYLVGEVEMSYYINILRQIREEETEFVSHKSKHQRIRQLNFMELFYTYADTPIVNNMVSDALPTRDERILPQKNVLISLVKSDNVERYLDQSAKIYYTGKKFPSTVALNKLYYFMPYIKKKGIRDLYLIKIARVGTRKEGQPDNDPNDFRLVFEIEFVKKLFNDYKPIDLEIWHTFTDTTLKTVLAL